MRYFAEIAYNGADYLGWQRQNKGASVQQKIEETLSLLLRQPIEIVGCGRTDTGVHAKHYVFHFDFEGTFPKAFVWRLNSMLPKSIVFFNINKVANQAHARFDALTRSYEYHIAFQKSPFDQQTIWQPPYAPESLNFDHLQAAADLMLRYEWFSPFCKTGSDNKTTRCKMYRSEWKLDLANQRMVYHITADRFLRGMVRLTVGMCLNVALGKLTLAEVETALQQQTPLRISTSIPPHGLYLTNIIYPPHIFDLNT